MAGYDLLGIGNALVDVSVHVTDAFLDEHRLVKGAMTLVDAERADFLYSQMPPGVECSGGSCGNTMAGFASLGGSGAYIGKVKDDQLGRVFRHDLRSLGVDFDTPAAADGPATGCCLVLVTPDAQRTMCTYLGAATELTPNDIDPEIVEAAKVVYMEGYLFDPPDAQRAFAAAADMAHAAGGKVAITLSDGFCVDRHRDAFRRLVEDHTDILFANEDEILSLYQVATFDEAMQLVRGHCEVACLTRSEKGSVILSNNEVHVIDAEPVAAVIDTTGAGDQYAAGFLYGYTRDMDLATCGRIASIAAAEIISHNSSRPQANLAGLVKQRLG
jgi:sugar/nucleoside kinase (ribokinase family)